MGPEILAETLVPLTLFALIFGIVYIRNRENMALIERGINPRVREPRTKKESSLRYGLLLIGCGLGVVLARLIDVAMLPHRYLPSGILDQTQEHRNKMIYFAMIAIGGGAGLVLSYIIETKESRREKTLS